MVSYGNDDEDDQNDMSMSTTVINALKAKAQLQLLSEEKEPEGPADAAGPACSSILPPRPQGAAPDSVTKAINTLKRQYEMANESLNSKKTRNPSILEKLVDHLGINETGRCGRCARHRARGGAPACRAWPKAAGRGLRVWDLHGMRAFRAQGSGLRVGFAARRLGCRARRSGGARA